MKTGARYLLADIGGTFARFAVKRQGGAPAHHRQYRTAEHQSLAAAIDAYLGTLDGPRPRAAAIAVAAPIVGERVRMTNAAWSFSRTGLARACKFRRVDLLNDFEALAWSLEGLGARRRERIGGGRGEKGRPMAVFGPGTGLGVACFLPAAAGGPAAIATEGGHADIAATTEREAAVIAVLRRRFGHVSAERLLSGPGLTNIHAALCAIDGREPSAPLRPGDIARAAQARGRARDARARETVAMFSALLGQLAGDLALGFGARGGVYVAGGVVARLGPAFDRKLFRRRFEDKGRYRDWLKPVPVWLITHPHPAMLGLARYLARSARTRA